MEYEKNNVQGKYVDVTSQQFLQKQSIKLLVLQQKVIYKYSNNVGDNHCDIVIFSD